MMSDGAAPRYIFELSRLRLGMGDPQHVDDLEGQGQEDEQGQEEGQGQEKKTPSKEKGVGEEGNLGREEQRPSLFSHGKADDATQGTGLTLDDDGGDDEARVAGRPPTTTTTMPRRARTTRRSGSRRSGVMGPPPRTSSPRRLSTCEDAPDRRLWQGGGGAGGSIEAGVPPRMLCELLQAVLWPSGVAELLEAAFNRSDVQHAGISLGPACSGLGPHGSHGAAWNLVLAGERRWFVLPKPRAEKFWEAVWKTPLPGAAPTMTPEHVALRRVTEGLFRRPKMRSKGDDHSSIFQEGWLSRAYPGGVDFSRPGGPLGVGWAGLPEFAPLQCTQRAGDLVLLPQSILHAAVTARDTFSLVGTVD